MSFITGMLLIDAPASALNNRGMVASAGQENVSLTKTISAEGGYKYPYVSAQALRYWLRASVEGKEGWSTAPVFREGKIAYSDANPIRYADDDLFGYMRAPSKKSDANRKEHEAATPVTAELTRVSPTRVSTLVALAPSAPTRDFGTMTRGFEGAPVPHEHEFYRVVLRGALSIDLSAVGTFTYQERAGFRNLDDVRKELAVKEQLEHLEGKKAYRLPLAERMTRVGAILRSLGEIDGGAKQALHYTDTTPTIVAIGVFRGGNNPLYYLFGSDGQGGVRFKDKVLKEVEVGEAWGDTLTSPLYVGWRAGFCDKERERAEATLAQATLPHGYVFAHPREIFQKLADALEAHAAEWLA